MSLPCIEVADAPATEAYKADPTSVTLVGPAMDILKKSQGIIKVYYGLQTEDDKHVYVYNVWEDIKDHHRLQADAVTYPILGEKCAQFMTERSRMVHIQPTSEPYAALGAPATELAYVTVKPGQSKEKVETIGSSLMNLMNELGDKGGVISAVWGPTVEKDDTIAFIIGWTSVEAHWNTVKSNPDAIKLLGELREIADITLTHANLKEY